MTSKERREQLAGALAEADRIEREIVERDRAEDARQIAELAERLIQRTSVE